MEESARIREEYHDKIFNDCCYFIERFAASNSKNQLAVFYSGIHRAIEEPRSTKRMVQLMKALESLTRENAVIVKQIDLKFIDIILKLNDAEPKSEYLRLLASVLHCGVPRKDECAHVVRMLCVEGRGSHVLFRHDGKKGYVIPRKDVNFRTYLTYEECQVFENIQICSMSDTSLGYELCLTELLYKCSCENNSTAETISQSILSVAECCNAIEVAGEDMLVAGVFALFLDQVYFAVEDPVDSIVDDDSLWTWFMSVGGAIDRWAVKVGARNKTNRHVSTTTLDVESQDHYYLKVVIPALDHFFGSYYVPETRQAVVKRLAEALSFMLQQPTVSRLSTTDCAIVSSCLDRIRSRGIKLIHIKNTVVEIGNFDTDLLNKHVSTIDSALENNDDSAVIAGENETRRVQEIIFQVAALLEDNTSVSVETEFHAIVEILKTDVGGVDENLVKLLVGHGMAQVGKLDKVSVQSLLVAICRMLRHSVEEERFICMSCSYSYDVLVGDPKNGVPPGTPYDIIDGRNWRCPNCRGPKSKFVSKRSSIQEVLCGAGAAKFVVTLMSTISRQSELIVARCG